MSSSFIYEDRTRVIPHRAVGYARRGRGGENDDENDDGDGRLGGSFAVDTYWNFDVAGDGQVYSTVEDLCRWDQMLCSQQGSQLYELMHQQATLNSGEKIEYALGLRLSSYRGVPTIGHGGAWGGYRSTLLRFPAQHMSIAITCNLGSLHPEQLAQKTADIFLATELGPHENQPAETPAAGPGPASSPGEEDETTASAWNVEGFAGEYYSQELDVTYALKSSTDGSCLWWTLKGSEVSARRLVAISPKQLVTKTGELVFDFDAASDGGFVLHAGRVKNVGFRHVG